MVSLTYFHSQYPWHQSSSHQSVSGWNGPHFPIIREGVDYSREMKGWGRVFQTFVPSSGDYSRRGGGGGINRGTAIVRGNKVCAKNKKNRLFNFCSEIEILVDFLLKVDVSIYLWYGRKIHKILSFIKRKHIYKANGHFKFY